MALENSSVQKPQPAFETNTVRIDYLTTSPQGINVKLRGIGRNALNKATGFAHNLTTSPEQRQQYRNALTGEAAFQARYSDSQGNKRNLLDDYIGLRDKNGPHDPTSQLAWTNYRQAMERGNKIGARNLSYNSDTAELTGEAINTPFVLYNLYAQPGSSPEILGLSEAAASAMVVTTKDNRLIIQHRAIEKPRMLSEGKIRGNGQFADVPGVSVAGMLDAKPSNKPGVPQNVDTEFIMAGIMKEAGEELGLGPEHLKNQRIVGVATDKTKIHTEFLFSARTDLTAAELNEVSRTSTRNKNLGDADFEEKFMTIEASPKAIRTLLTDIQCPLPPTHAAAIFATGYAMILEERGIEVANRWRTIIEREMNQNSTVVNQRVADYYAHFPEALHKVPERLWTSKHVPERNPTAYSPAYGPEEQGLPSLEDELVRTGLKPETRQVIEQAHLFDVDGVLSDPHEKRVIHDEIFDQLIKRLKADEPVCLNTGRSADWVLENVATPLTERLGEEGRQYLKLLSVVGEKGGSWATFDERGALNRGYAAALTLPEELIQKVNQLLAEDPEFSQMMTTAVDPHKKTMISPEMTAIPEGVSKDAHLTRFHAAQVRFANQAEQLLQEAGLTHLFKVDKTTIATDIESPYAGKDLGAERFLEILKAQNINFQKAEFTTYGDSASDIAMAEELERRGLDTEFIYVGKKRLKLSAQKILGYAYHVENVGDYTDGTLEYLRH